MTVSKRRGRPLRRERSPVGKENPPERVPGVLWLLASHRCGLLCLQQQLPLFQDIVGA